MHICTGLFGRTCIRLRSLSPSFSLSLLPFSPSLPLSLYPYHFLTPPLALSRDPLTLRFLFPLFPLCVCALFVCVCVPVCVPSPDPSKKKGLQGIRSLAESITSGKGKRRRGDRGNRSDYRHTSNHVQGEDICVCLCLHRCLFLRACVCVMYVSLFVWSHTLTHIIIYICVYTLASGLPKVTRQPVRVPGPLRYKRDKFWHLYDAPRLEALYDRAQAAHREWYVCGWVNGCAYVCCLCLWVGCTCAGCISLSFSLLITLCRFSSVCAVVFLPHPSHTLLLVITSQSSPDLPALSSPSALCPLLSAFPRYLSVLQSLGSKDSETTDRPRTITSRMSEKELLHKFMTEEEREERERLLGEACPQWDFADYKYFMQACVKVCRCGLRGQGRTAWGVISCRARALTQVPRDPSAVVTHICVTPFPLPSFFSHPLPPFTPTTHYKTCAHTCTYVYVNTLAHI